MTDFRTAGDSDPLTPVPQTAESRTADPLTGDHPLTAGQQRRLDSLLEELDQLASELDGRPEALLLLLRQLEQRHRTIQDGPFRGSLPADRNQLFNLLQNMERSGGWPYIPRLQLRTFMDLLQRGSDQPDHPLAA